MSVRRILLKWLGIALIGVFWAIAGPGSAAEAQAPSPTQPWGLPPLPPGVGAVEKFADISETPQGKFLEGGAFDDQGNLWFVAIGSGWISYLTPDGKLVPVVNCNPPDDLGADLRAAGYPLARGQTLSDHPAPRHSDLRSQDQRAQNARLYLAQPAVQRTQRPRLRCRGEPVLHRSLGYGSGTQPVGPGRGHLPIFARWCPAQGDG